jgi:hypothetical protein
LQYVKLTRLETTTTDGSQNTFLNYFGQFTSIYEAISADLLHQIELGVFGKHFWLWVISKGDPGYLSDEELDALDDRYSALMALRDVDLLIVVSNGCRPCQESTTFRTAW